MEFVRGVVRDTFDPGDAGLRWRPTLLRSLVVALATVFLVWLLKPDLFGLVPNALDPMFYTGYAFNLDDALLAAGNRHYFVTRWTTYMPMYVFGEIFGLELGRLLLRLVMIVVLAEMLWRLGHRLSFSVRARWTGIFAVVTSPMYVRAFTTDYQEYFILWASMVLITLVIWFSESSRMWTAGLIGVIAVSMLIANPFIAMLIGLSTFWAVVLLRTSAISLARLIVSMLVALLCAVVVVTVGYLQFKYRYNVPNIYKPTLDFMTSYQPPDQDGWTAPSRAWLTHFSWIYLTPVLAISLGLLSRGVDKPVRRILMYVSLLTLSLFLAHVYVEFERGHALETSYYWSLSLGPVLLSIFMIVGRISQRWPGQHLVTAALITLMLMFWRVPQQLQLPAGAGLFIVLLGLIFISALVIKFQPAFAVVCLLSMILWSQIGAPTYSVRTYGNDLNTPRYDLVYKDPQGQSELILDETLWFLGQMDQIENDWESTFLTAGGWSAAIVGTYIPHPFSRWMVPLSDTQVFSANVRDELEFGHRPILVLYGDPTTVGQYRNRTLRELPRARELLDVTHSRGLGYRLLVMTGNGVGTGQSLISMSRLDREIGRLAETGHVIVSRDSPSGFVSFGPYMGLGAGEYSATLTYDSRAIGKLGQLEVFEDGAGTAVKSEIVSSGKGLQTVDVDFVVKRGSGTWQFRTIQQEAAQVVYMFLELRKIN